MAVLSISLPDNLLADADRVIAERGYGGRSEFLRACVRDFLVANAAQHPKPGPCSATLTLVYPDGREQEFSKVRHRFPEIVRTAIHGHVGASCLEVYVLEGSARRIQAFADALRGTRNATQVSLTFTDACNDLASPPAENGGPAGKSGVGKSPSRIGQPTGANRV